MRVGIELGPADYQSIVFARSHANIQSNTF